MRIVPRLPVGLVATALLLVAVGPVARAEEASAGESAEEVLARGRELYVEEGPAAALPRAP